MSEQEQNQNHNLATVLKEVSDIKASLAVNTNETQNIKATLSEIKSDIKDMKTDSVNRREFNEIVAGLRKEFTDGDGSLKVLFTESLKAIKADTDLLKKVMYGIASAIGLSILYAILKLVIIK